jgi:hypothetical protein
VGSVRGSRGYDRLSNSYLRRSRALISEGGEVAGDFKKWSKAVAKGRAIGVANQFKAVLVRLTMDAMSRSIQTVRPLPRQRTTSLKGNISSSQI